MSLPQPAVFDSLYEQKQQWMLDQLADTWADNNVWRIWEVDAYKEQVKDKKGGKTFRNSIYFERCTSDPLKTEIKYACYTLATSSHWHPVTFSKIGTIINQLIKWLNSEALKEESLDCRNLQDWEDSLEGYLKQNGLYRAHLRSQEEAASLWSIRRTKQRLILVVA